MCVPLIIGAAAMGIGSAISGAVSSENARAAQVDSANKAMDLQREVAGQQQKNYEQSRADMAPWLKSGTASLAELMRRQQAGEFNTTLDPSQLANDPGYQFRMAEGQKALERSAAARGGLNSGGTMKALGRYSQGLASDEFQNAWNRNEMGNTNRFNRLASLAGVGQAAAQNLGAMGSQYNSQLGQGANSMGNIYGAIGNANAAGAMGMGNAISGGMNTVGNMFTLGAMGAFGGGQQIPTQGQSYAGGMGMNPRFGFGLNYGG